MMDGYVLWRRPFTQFELILYALFYGRAVLTDQGDKPIKSGILIALLPFLAISALIGFRFCQGFILLWNGLNNGNANGAAVVDGEAIYIRPCRGLIRTKQVYHHE
ncbi:hypothetical protein HA051_06900 [Chromobacterium vaccinii]|nr:hypothetical protein [Chromobacterium vaccinii]